MAPSGRCPRSIAGPLQKIIPDLLIDGRYLKQNLAGPGFDALAAIRTMIDIKTLSCCDKYASCHDSTAASVVNKRQEEASAAYRTKAKELDHLFIAKQVVAVSPLDTPDPYESVLNGFGKVLAPVVGAFAEMPSDVHLLTADHCEYFAALPSEIKGMFLIRAPRSLASRHTAVGRACSSTAWTHRCSAPSSPRRPSPRGAQPRPLHGTTRLWTPTTTTTPPPASTLVLRAKGALFLCWLKPDPTARGGERK